MDSQLVLLPEPRSETDDATPRTTTQRTTTQRTTTQRTTPPGTPHRAGRRSEVNHRGLEAAREALHQATRRAARREAERRAARDAELRRRAEAPTLPGLPGPGRAA